VLFTAQFMVFSVAAKVEVVMSVFEEVIAKLRNSVLLAFMEPNLDNAKYI
jgi:hypothetical protein